MPEDYTDNSKNSDSEEESCCDCALCYCSPKSPDCACVKSDEELIDDEEKEIQSITPDSTTCIKFNSGLYKNKMFFFLE